MAHAAIDPEELLIRLVVLASPQQYSNNRQELEIAARIGSQLLAQNQELQIKNAFLEEQLTDKDKDIDKLTHDLQKQKDLLRIFSHLDDQDSANPEFEDTLKGRISRLNCENARLKSESAKMRHDFEEKCDAAKREIEDLSRHLELANNKVPSSAAVIDELQSVRLQQQLSAKSSICVDQEMRMKQLMHEVELRQRSEKQLSTEVTDLLAELKSVQAAHEQLTCEIIEIQDAYTEVKAMYDDAAEELKVAKAQNPANRRVPSIDSLYDSLASELETSDSGFSSTPYVSARSDGTCLRNELALLGLKDFGEIDILNPVIAEVANSKILTRPKTPPQTPRSEVLAVVSVLSVQIAHSTPTLAEIEPAPIASSTPFYEAAERKPIRAVATACIETQTDPEPKPTTSSETSKDVACTPEPVIVRPNGLRLAHMQTASTSQTSSGSSPQVGLEVSGNLSKSSSSDSLSDYVGPKVGEPGMPGSRDLDFCMRLLRAKKQVEAEYARFRQRHGLPAKHFFDSKQPDKSVTPKPGVWSNYALLIGGEQQQKPTLPWSTQRAIGLGSILHQCGTGVLSRAELPPTPQSSPIHGHSVPILPSQPPVPLSPFLSTSPSSLPLPRLGFPMFESLPTSGIISRRL